MSKFAIAVGCAALTLTGVSFAGGMGHYRAPTTTTATNNPFVYAHLNVGYALRDMKHTIGTYASDQAWKRGNWTFAYGADAGYHFAKDMAVEGGYVRLLDSRLTTGGNTYKFKDSAAYIAFRGDFHPTQNLDLFAKLGYGMQFAKADQAFLTATGSSTKNVGGVMFGAGASYNVGNNVDLQLGYLHFTGDVSNLAGSTRIVPAVDMITLGVGYQFDV